MYTLSKAFRRSRPYADCAPNCIVINFFSLLRELVSTLQGRIADERPRHVLCSAVPYAEGLATYYQLEELHQAHIISTFSRSSVSRNTLCGHDSVLQVPTFDRVIGLQPQVLADTVGDPAKTCDLSIALVLIYYLRRSRTGFQKAKLNY